MNPRELIVAKRDGRRLAEGEIAFLIEAYTAGRIPDYQMSAFLMAAFLRGLDDVESQALTLAMLESGVRVDLSDIPGTKVDKHSTGGVGDKISLSLAPLVAACGIPVPMISGRGLGHSGGTLDKLESVPGLSTNLTVRQYHDQIARIGIAMIGQTEQIAPADRKLYALRDVTGTVAYPPFIAASIMSKKLAEGADALVLDVKTGSGAFMREESDARRLAETLVQIGERFDTPTVANLTQMDHPLGWTVGNWPEMVEAIACLRGEHIPDVRELTLTLAAEMLVLGGAADTLEEGRRKATIRLDGGFALERLIKMVEAQGGDSSCIEQPEVRDVAPAAVVRAGHHQNGILATIDSRAIGYTCVALGAGRKRIDDRVDPLAGIRLLKRPGAEVNPGEPLAELFSRRTRKLEQYSHAVRDAFVVSDEPPTPRPLVIDRYDANGWASP